MSPFQKIACVLGFHDWRYLRSISFSELRSQVRNEVRNEHCGRTIGGRQVHDRICLACKCRVNSIDKESEVIRREEQEIWDQIRQDRDNAIEFHAMMEAVDKVSKSLSVVVDKPRDFAQYERPSCVTGRSWCFGTPSEPGDYEWASMVHSLNPDEVTVYRNYNGQRQTWGRDVWFRKISGASNAE